MKDDNSKLNWKVCQVYFDEFKKPLGLKGVKSLCEYFKIITYIALLLKWKSVGIIIRLLYV